MTLCHFLKLTMPDLKTLLTLTAASGERFLSCSAQTNRNGTVFGGQLLAQALQAAAATVPDKRVQALQACFERPTRAASLDYKVRRGQDGRTISTRRVTASQAGSPVLSAMLSFGSSGQGFEHSARWREAPPEPEALPTLAEAVTPHASAVSEHGKGRLTTYSQVEVRPIEVEQHLLLEVGPARARIWIRARGELPAAATGNVAVLAYLSDYLMVNAALIPHVRDLPDEHLFVASLEHSMWFHAEADPSDWLLYETESPWSGEGRVLCMGRLFTRKGLLVATVAQHALVRRRRPSISP